MEVILAEAAGADSIPQLVELVALQFSVGILQKV
jgi:hypothetical protein